MWRRAHSRKLDPPTSASEAGPSIYETRYSGWQQGFTALRQRNFRLYWTGQLISQIGTFMQATGQAWLVLRITQSGVQLGLVGALQYLPVLLFALFGGVLADRWPKRAILIATQSAQMIQALVLWELVASNHVKLWEVDLLAVLLGITSSLDQPTRSAIVVELVGKDDLPNAIALNAGLMNFARILGPGVGGIVIASSGVGALFLINALSFLPILADLLLMHRDDFFHQPPQPGSVPQRLSTLTRAREGLIYVWQSPPLALVIGVVGLVLLFGANFSVVLPLIATDVLHGGATAFGLLSAAMGLGALSGTIWLMWSAMTPSIARVLGGTLAFSIALAAFALSPNLPLAMVMIAATGCAEAIFGALATTVMQMIALDALRGRVASVAILFFTGSIPPGYLLAGWLSSQFGAALGLLICAALCLTTVGIGWWRRGPAEASLAART